MTSTRQTIAFGQVSDRLARLTQCEHDGARERDGAGDGGRRVMREADREDRGAERRDDEWRERPRLDGLGVRCHSVAPGGASRSRRCRRAGRARVSLMPPDGPWTSAASSSLPGCGIQPVEHDRPGSEGREDREHREHRQPDATADPVGTASVGASSSWIRMRCFTSISALVLLTRHPRAGTSSRSRPRVRSRRPACQPSRRAR